MFKKPIRYVMCCGVVVIGTALHGLSGCASGGNGEASKTPGPDTTAVPSSGGDCNYVNYHHDEAANAGGAAKCTSDCDCDGMRTCTAGSCEGTARPANPTPETCNNKDYHYNEKWTEAGAGKCASDCECDGLRSCKAGQCEGTAR